jgi:hypothetical protein
MAEPDRTGVKKRNNRKNAAKNDLTAGIFFNEYSFMVFRFMYYFSVKYFYTTRNSINTRNDKDMPSCTSHSSPILPTN